MPAPGDRAGCKRPHDTLDSLGKSGHRPARSTLHARYVRCPRTAAPCLMSLDFFMPKAMHADEIVTSIGGRKGVIYATEDGAARMSTAHQTGRFKGSHGVGPMLQMDGDVRGTVPSLAGSDGAENFSSAHERVLGNSDEGKPSMRTRHIRLGGDINTNPRERDNDTLEDFAESCRGLKSLDSAYVGCTRPTSTPQERTWVGACGPWRRRGRTLSIPTGGLPSYETRQITTTPSS